MSASRLIPAPRPVRRAERIILICVSMILSTSCGLSGLLRASRAKVSLALESASLSEATAAPALVQFRPGTGGSVSPRAGIAAAARVVTATTSPAAVMAREIFAKMSFLHVTIPPFSVHGNDNYYGRRMRDGEGRARSSVRETRRLHLTLETPRLSADPSIFGDRFTMTKPASSRWRTTRSAAIAAMYSPGVVEWPGA